MVVSRDICCYRLQCFVQTMRESQYSYLKLFTIFYLDLLLAPIILFAISWSFKEVSACYNLMRFFYTCLGGLSLPRKSVVRLTDYPDMTLDVYRGRKITTQQQQNPEKAALVLLPPFAVGVNS